MKKTRLALFQSVVALILCVSMLTGTTFAWFTDSATSKNNLIASGILDVKLEYLNGEGKWVTVDEETEVLDKNALWEPGYTEVAYLRVSNAGNLALKYAFGVGILKEIGSINSAGQKFFLSDYIRFGVIESDKQPNYATREDARKALTSSKPIVEGYSSKNAQPLYPKNNADKRPSECYVTLVVYMPEDVGNVANHATGVDAPEIELGIQLKATQADYESDSFGSDYDSNLALSFNFPNERIENTTSVGVGTNEDNKVSASVTLEGEQTIAVIPEGVLVENGTSVLTLEVSSLSKSEANITLEENEEARSLNVHVAGVSADNTQPMAITIKEAAAKGLNAGNLKLYHVENGETVEMTAVTEFTAHNQFKYDPATGDVTLYMATFSEVALVADTVNAWEGNFDYSWYNASKTELTIANADQLAAFGAIVGGMNGKTQDSFAGKNVKLIADVNLGDKDDASSNLFYPIGYYNDAKSYTKPTDGNQTVASVAAFMGTFDGNGHTIANFYQNTWQMWGNYDGNNYKIAMGLFGYVLNGTVKNLTVSNFSSDGEYTPTGVIAAYADGNSTFENIAITNCNPRVYNTGNGGIIGIAGDTSVANDDHITLKNITVDNSNKISALWGSWDVACGGLVGMYRGNVDGSGKATDDTISFENCHVSAQIDVYNDVCANYQYYAYRYAGMIIGSVRHNTTNTDGKTIPNMAGISASGCTVNYGTWNDYYYCEFEKNTMASYSEDYQFSRMAHSDFTFTDSNGNGIIDTDAERATMKCAHPHTDAEDKTCVYLPFHQLFTGYSWGVSSIGLKEYSGIVTDLGITEGDQQESVVKFATKFTGDFLYRVGNQNTVSLGSLFAAAPKKDADGNELKDESGKPVYWDINNSGVVVAIDKVDENSNVAGVFNNENKENKKDWTESTIKFSGTGVVKVTIQDYNFCTPTELIVEVVDATNVTGLSGTISGNVVLLNDCGLSSLTVSGRNTVYGNGFTATYTGNGQYLNNGLKQGVVTVTENGKLDNLRIEASIYPASYLYYDEVKKGPSSTESDKTRYHYQLSAVAASGNATISNCYIYGARNNIYVGNGNVTIKDTILENGTLSNVQIQSTSDYTVTLHNVTTIQTMTESNVGTSGMNMLGAGIVVGPETESNPKIVLSGNFKQYNWVTSADKEAVSNDNAKTIMSTALNQETFYHNINGRDAVNLGVVYLNGDTAVIENKTGLPYVKETITAPFGTGQVYSLVNSSDIYTDSDSANKNTVNGAYEPQFKYSADLGGQYIEKTDDGDEFCYREGDTIKVMFPNGDNKELNLASMVDIQKYSDQDLNLVITVKDGKGDDVTVTNGKITLSAAGDYTVTYTVTDTLFYDKNGNVITDDNTRAAVRSSKVEYSWDVIVSVALKETAIPNAYFEFDATKQVIYRSGNSNIVQFIPFLAGLKIYDYNGQTAYLRFEGDKDFNKIAKASIENINTTGEGQGYHIVTVELVDGGKIVIDMDVRANTGSGTHSGSIKVRNDVLYVVNGGTTSGKGQTWKIYSYKFVGNNGTEINSGLVTFGTSGVDCDTATKPSSNFGTTIKYTVTYDANGGNCGQSIGYATSAAAAVTLPTPARSGYIFAGWYTAASGGTRVGGAGENYTPTANITLYAQWGKPCDVTYNANGGSCGTASEKYTGTALTLPTPTRDGYWFVGWYDAAEGGNKIGDAGTTYNPSGETTLYAHWQEAIKYTVTYNANGGSCGTASATYEGTALTLPTPTRTGYTFNGWYTAASGGTKIGETYIPSANITLYAQWQINSYTITVTTNNATVKVNGTTVNNNGTVSIQYGAQVTVEVTYSETKEQSTTIKGTDGTIYTSPFTMPAQNVTINATSTGCVTPDTLITLANGKQVRVDSLTGNEQLLVWNLETGKYDTAPIVFVDNDAEDTYEIIHLYFSDGSDVKVIYEHGFFDLDLGEYVYIDADNYADYIGHRFVTEGNIESNNWNIVTLDDVVIETEVTTAWSPVTFEHLCYYTNGVLSMPGGIEGLFNIFEVDTDLMRYDEAKMQKDIETYGLFTIEDFGGMITEDAFNAFNGAYLKVAIAKGNLTWEDIAYMAERYIPLM